MKYQSKVRDLLKQRANIHTQMTELVDAAEARDEDKRSLTAEESAKFDEMSQRMDELDEQRKRLEDLDQREADLADAEKRYGPLTSEQRTDAGPSEFEKNLRAFLAGERRALTITPEGDQRFDVRQLRAIATQSRDLAKSPTTAGGHTVGTAFYAQLVDHLIEVSGVMQAGPTVLITDKGENLPIPRTTAHSTATSEIAEGAAITESDPTFNQLVLGAYKYGVLVQVSYELIEDTYIDLLGYLAMQAGRAVGNAFGTRLVTGTGSSQPQGVATAATVGVTGGAGVTGAFTADNLIDLYFSVVAAS